MEITRRDFVKTGSVAAAAGAAGCVTAMQGVEDTIASVKFIDIHAHCTEDPMPPCYLPDKRPLPVPEDLIRHYDRIGIEKGVILALCNPENFIGGMSTEQILRTCARYPDRFIPSVAVDPRAMGNRTFNSKFGDVFKYYRDKGCRVCGEVCANLHFLDPRMQNLFKGCVINLHIKYNRYIKKIFKEHLLCILSLC